MFDMNYILFEWFECSKFLLEVKKILFENFERTNIFSKRKMAYFEKEKLES